jgi:sugar lactone lactonase YvrE
VWGAGQVRRYDPAGRLVATLTVPARQPTSVCLTDVEGQSCLVVTSARVGLVDPSVADGAVLVAPVEATAPPAHLFGAA